LKTVIAVKIEQIYEPLLTQLAQSRWQGWGDELRRNLPLTFSAQRHGEWARWASILARLPEVKNLKAHLDRSAITLEGELIGQTVGELETLLREFHPWRKGPFDLFGVSIDTEWRSDLKWNRLAHALTSLEGRTVLDVGCGSGYHCWRMRGAGARRVMGIDPTLLSVLQFLIVRHFLCDEPVDVLPVGIDDVPGGLAQFDTVFSMGILYHRRSPLDHLLDLKGLLRPGGELVLETLVIEGGEGQVLVPRDRYAQMRNVWFIPSCLTLESWLVRTGFRNIRLIDVTSTTSIEQRATSWMHFNSLSDFLDPHDSSRTVEGLPAPQRAIFIAETPD
jgi:tRNA (mo5U34)-methyltransferase